MRHKATKNPYSIKRLSAAEHLVKHGFDRDFTASPFDAYHHEEWLAAMSDISEKSQEMSESQGFSVDQMGQNTSDIRAEYADSDSLILMFGIWNMARVNENDALFVGEEVLWPLQDDAPKRAHPICHRQVKGWVAVCPESHEILGLGLLPNMAVVAAEMNLLNRYIARQDSADHCGIYGIHPYFKLTMKSLDDGSDHDPEVVFIHPDSTDGIGAVRAAALEEDEVESLEEGYGMAVKMFGRMNFYADPYHALEALTSYLFPSAEGAMH